MRKPNKKKHQKVMWNEIDRVCRFLEENHPNLTGTSGRKKFAVAAGINYGDLYYYNLGRQMNPEAAFKVFSNLRKKKIFIDRNKLCSYHLALIGIEVDDSEQTV